MEGNMSLRDVEAQYITLLRSRMDYLEEVVRGPQYKMFEAWRNHQVNVQMGYPPQGPPQGQQVHDKSADQPETTAEELGSEAGSDNEAEKPGDGKAVDESPGDGKPLAAEEHDGKQKGGEDKDAQKSPASEQKADPSSDEKEDSEQSRYKVFINQRDPKTGEHVDVPWSTASNVNEPDSLTAFTFRKFRDREDDEEEESGIVIESTPLQNLIDQAITKYGGRKNIAQIDSPYWYLVWSWEELEKAAGKNDEDDKETGQARRDLKKLMGYIHNSSGSKMLDKYFRTRTSMADTHTITYETLWLLFPCGRLVVASPFLRQEQVFLVERCWYTEGHRELKVMAYAYDWDGHEFNRAVYTHTIPRFENRKQISELEICPLEGYRCMQNSESGETREQELKQRLIARGQLYHKRCKGRAVFQYQRNSKAYVERDTRLFAGDEDPTKAFYRMVTSGPSRERNLEDLSSSIEPIDGPVVVDFESFLTHHKEDAPTLGLLQRSTPEFWPDLEKIQCADWDKNDGDKPLSDEQYLLCPPRVLGYSMYAKRWVQLDVQKLDPRPAPDETTFRDKLQLSKDYKAMIRGAVMSHDKPNIADFIDEKGRGLVILLWGVPGVGKTLTAESVAKLAGRPLFSVSVSDMGINSDKVEENLQRVFKLAGLWKAVLLFDEADVFLEARDSNRADLTRNTIVSVLLRVLEYYNGILILTTNRLRSFDIAVQSRIHIAIEYKDLEPDQKERLFRSFIDQLKNKDLVEETAAINSWLEEDCHRCEVNGRQIRNIVSTAMGLAHSNGRGLAKGDLVKAVNNTEAFRRANAKSDIKFRNLHTDRD